MQIQFSPEQITELEGMARQITPADAQALETAQKQLFEQGMAPTGDNWMFILRAFNYSATVPITVDSVAATAHKYRDSLTWLSAEEVEYNKLTARLGPEVSETIRKFLPRYRLSDEEGGDLWINFVTIGDYVLRTGRAATPETLQRMMTDILRQPRVNVRWSSKLPKKVQAEIDRKAEAEAKRHADYLEFKKRNSPEGLKKQEEEHLAAAKAAFQEQWHKRVIDYIASLRSNNDRALAQELFGKSYEGVDWEKTFNSLHIWAERQKYPRNASARWV